MTDPTDPPDGAEAPTRRNHVSAALYLVGPPPHDVVCCRCDEPITDATAVNVPGLRARGWSHRSCLPDWLLP